jgi:hypothetical protein
MKDSVLQSPAMEPQKKECVSQVAQKVAWAQRQEDLARTQLIEAESVRQFWEELSRHLSDGNAASVLLVLIRNS